MTRAGWPRWGCCCKAGRSIRVCTSCKAPEFALARFQLGFLDLTSGRALDAIGVWSPLGNLPDDEPLRVLAEGLSHMAGDNFDEARRLLLKGMALNSDNPLINADMQLILDEIANLPDKAAEDAGEEAGGGPALSLAAQDDADAPGSAVHLLLQQSQLRGGGSKRKH
jgi:hypothetical protein